MKEQLHIEQTVCKQMNEIKLIMQIRLNLMLVPVRKNSCFPMQTEQMVDLVWSRDMHQNFNLCKIKRMIAATWTKFLSTHWLQHLANSVQASNHDLAALKC